LNSDQFEVFYRRYYRLVLTTAHQRLGCFADAQDAASTVFRIAWEHSSAGNELSLAWIYQTLRNVIGNEYRHQGRNKVLLNRLALGFSEATEPEPIDELITTRAAMNELPMCERELLRMAYWEDLTAPEMAKILACTPTAIRLRLFRARSHMKSILTNRTTETEETPPLTKEVTPNAVNQIQNQSGTPNQRKPTYASHCPRGERTL
jgi:RNA polymerase sigma-70 factor (ECF subfamily)